MVDKEIIENLCVSIRGSILVEGVCVPYAEAFLFVPLSGTNKKMVFSQRTLRLCGELLQIQ